MGIKLSTLNRFRMQCHFSIFGPEFDIHYSVRILWLTATATTIMTIIIVVVVLVIIHCHHHLFINFINHFILVRGAVYSIRNTGCAAEIHPEWYNMHMHMHMHI